MPRVVKFNGLLYGYGVGPVSKRALKENLGSALARATFNADEFVVGLDKSPEVGIEEVSVEGTFDSIAQQDLYLDALLQHDEIDKTIVHRDGRRVYLYTRSTGTAGGGDYVHYSVHVYLKPHREEKRELYIKSVGVPYLGGLHGLIEQVVSASVELDYARVTVARKNWNYTYEVDYAGVEYTSELPLDRLCVVFFPSMLERFITNRIYVLNTPCWKVEEMDNPDGKAIVMWAYDPDVLESQGFVETDKQAKAMYDMGEYLGLGSYEPDPSREWRPERLSEPRGGLYEESTKTLWATRNILSDDEDQKIYDDEANDYGVILKVGYLPGDDERRPIERVAFLFSRKESAALNLRLLSLRGLETWYVDPALGKQRMPLPEGIRGWNDDGTHGPLR